MFNLVADYWDQWAPSLDAAQDHSISLQTLEALLLSQVETGLIPQPEANAIYDMLEEDWELCNFGPDFLAKLHLDPTLAKWLDHRAATNFLELTYNRRFLKPMTVAGLKKALAETEIAQSNGTYDAPILLGSLPRAGPNYTKHLVGNRWLYRGGSILFVGPTGTGKSSFAIQLGIHWACGKPCFGLKPSGPLRVLYIQAENDPEDVAEVRDDVYKALGFLPLDQEVANCNFSVIHKVDATGSRIIAWLAGVLADHPCDILILDPLMAYIGGDVTQQAITSAFLREGLQPLISKHQIGVIVVHHPPKPKIHNPKETAQSDSYYGAGSADIANWVRGVMTLMETKNLGLFKLHLPKRGKRVGWMEADGITPKIEMDVAHGRGGRIYWREADPNEGFLPKKPDTTRADILALIPMSGQILQVQVIELAVQKSIGRNRVLDTLKLLEADKQIRTVPFPRAACRWPAGWRNNCCSKCDLGLNRPSPSRRTNWAWATCSSTDAASAFRLYPPSKIETNRPWQDSSAIPLTMRVSAAYPSGVSFIWAKRSSWAASNPAEMSTKSGLNAFAAGLSFSSNTFWYSASPEPADRGTLSVNPTPFASRFC